MNSNMLEQDEATGPVNEGYQREIKSSSPYDEDEKSVYWMGGMVQCFSNVFNMFGRSDFKSIYDKEWEVPYGELKDLSFLRSGAQGMVYRGTLRGEIVAIKKVRHKCETNIKHLSKLNHENIVRFRGVCDENPDYCLIMEYCQYGSLYDFLGKATLRPTQFVKWAKDIATGMQYLHSHKIIHRDLKSPNVLISDDLVVKVSDFGTSRVWDNVSTIMTFNGTVAWMAPEVIRQEPCSERVDVWSYGVVLWEMLTKEVPYKNMEAPSIMWGVGTDTLALPIPLTCPNSLQMLLCQCWNRVPKNRPPFKIIMAHLEMAAPDIISMDDNSFRAKQTVWGEEVRDGMERIFERNEKRFANTIQPKARDLREAQEVYEKQLSRANELYMEVCAVRLQLEERERLVAIRERQLEQCRCHQRKLCKIYRQASTSSDSQPTTSEDRRRSNKKSEAQLLVNYVDKTEGKTVTLAVDQCECNVDTALNNNLKPNKPKETVVEANGNVEIHDKEYQLDAQLPDVAQV